jgi:hypoxanthine phosphoribosyltransferase
LHDHRNLPYIPFTYEFIRVKSYQGTSSTGNVQISGCDLSKLSGKRVLLVEDIIDTGLTMQNVLAYLREVAVPASVQVVSLLEKRTVKNRGYEADYVGFSVPDECDPISLFTCLSHASC